MSSLIKRRPLVTFFILAYVISWASFFALSGPFLFPFGSILAAIIVAASSEGRVGLKDLLARCLRWNVAPWWYLAAIAVPVVIAIGALYLNSALGAAIPTRTEPLVWYEMLLVLPMAMFDAPIWEDAGWRGFAMPRFPADRSRFVNTLILGLLLAGWHLPLALSAGPIAVPYLVTTVLSAFVTNWIYYNSRESALLPMIYHGAANSMGLMFFKGYAENDLLHLYWLLTAMNLIAAVIVVLGSGKLWFVSGPQTNSQTRER